MGINPDTGELTGGIPLDVMEPGEGDLILKIKIEGQTIAQEDVIFASVPFSFYSQYATSLTQPIESKQIKDGAITVSHLSEEVTTYVKSLGVSKEELEEHKTEEAAHVATSISVRNTFKNLIGTDLQMLMESVDYNITLANKAIQVASESVDSDDIENGSVKEVDLDMSTFNGWDKNETDDLTASTVFGGALNGVYSDLQLADNSVNTNNIVDGAVTASKLAESYLPTTGGTLTGNLVMENTDIVMSDNNTVDGVDVSELKEKVDNMVNDTGEVDNIDKSLKPYAYGTVSAGDPLEDPALLNGYGIDSVTYKYRGWIYSVFFEKPRADTNYSISITPFCSVYSPSEFVATKNNNGFNVSFYYDSGSTLHSVAYCPFDFIVFANDE